jgi:mono/diheme cytochrome c family protein
MKMISHTLLAGISFLLITNQALAADGQAILEKQCATCHNLNGPAPQTVQEIWNRQGPDLFYAGNKYLQPWLVEWLQKPYRIRPAGEFYGLHIRSTPKGDEIDTSTLQPHVALSREDAVAVADNLMQRHPHDDLIARETITPLTLSKQMGEMAFDKCLGCMACHLIEPDYGGLSGPELYTAGRRLQAKYMASYIRSPQAWDPKSWMPNKHVSEPNIQKLVQYLENLSAEKSDGKK